MAATLYAPEVTRGLNHTFSSPEVSLRLSGDDYASSRILHNLSVRSPEEFESFHPRYTRGLKVEFSSSQVRNLFSPRGVVSFLEQPSSSLAEDEVFDLPLTFSLAGRSKDHFLYGVNQFLGSWGQCLVKADFSSPHNSSFFGNPKLSGILYANAHRGTAVPPSVV